MKKIQILFAGLLLVVLTGCTGSSDLEIENRELKRQIDTLQSRQEFLQNEINRLTQGELTIAEELETTTPQESDQLICGGPANFFCPDGYICLDKGEEENATGVCIAIDKVREYREAQQSGGATTDDTGSNTSSETAAAPVTKVTACGVLGEKLNRDPASGDTSRVCCAGLEASEVGSAYAICITPKNQTASSSAPAAEPEPEPAAEPEPTPEPEPEETAPAVIPDPEPEPEPATELEETTQTETTTSTTDQNYTVNGFAHYETQTGGFRMYYPQYWYFGGYGAEGNSLWVAGFAPQPLNDEGTNIVIKAELFDGTMPMKSGDGFCSAQIMENKWIKVSGPSSMQSTFCEMAESAQLID